MSLVRESGKTIVETISKQLEYVTKSLIYSHANNIVLNVKQLYFIRSSFSSLLLATTVV